MYINPFIAGILCTLIAQIFATVVFAIIAYKTKRRMRGGNRK